MSDPITAEQHEANIEKLRQEVARVKAHLEKRPPRRGFRFKQWDSRYQYQSDVWRPRVGKVFEVWHGPFGEPRLQLAVELGHSRLRHRPRVYDLNSDCTKWSKSLSGLGLCLAITVGRRWRVR